MFADQPEESQDSIILDGCSIEEDLNSDSIAAFRNRLSALKPQHPWIAIGQQKLFV